MAATCAGRDTRAFLSSDMQRGRIHFRAPGAAWPVRTSVFTKATTRTIHTAAPRGLCVHEPAKEICSSGSLCCACTGRAFLLARARNRSRGDDQGQICIVRNGRPRCSEAGCRYIYSGHHQAIPVFSGSREARLSVFCCVHNNQNKPESLRPLSFTQDD